MAETGTHTAQVQHWLDRLGRGDARAANDLLAHAGERLRRLTHRMLQRFPALQRWEQTDDVLQDATLRLHRSLSEVRPESARHFYNLAAMQIRRALLDLVKHHLGPRGLASHHHTEGQPGTGTKGAFIEQAADRAEEPATLEGWTRFHEAVESLPEPEREVFNLLWYEGLDQSETALVLGVTVRTVKRRWQQARLHLFEALQGEPPG